VIQVGLIPWFHFIFLLLAYVSIQKKRKPCVKGAQIQTNKTGMIRTQSTEHMIISELIKSCLRQIIKYKRMNKLSFLLFILFLGLTLQAQDSSGDSPEGLRLSYEGGETYEVSMYSHQFTTDEPKNIIFMIGDGMGVSQVFAALTANRGTLFLNNFKSIGFTTTQSASDYITDSAAAGTALATGVKTKNGVIGLDPAGKPVKNIVEEVTEHGIATGLVSTAAITHATPAAFIAHESSRNFYEAIAADFLDTDIDVFIGGGYDHFAQRRDGRNLVEELKEKGYQVLQDIDQIKKVKKGKLAGLTAKVHNPRVPERGDMLPVATRTAIRILDKDADGFFLMIEGSEIDWGGHDNDTRYIIEETLDFDQAIGEALHFAAKDGETLIIVTADHETGGFSIVGGNMESGDVKGAFTTGDHSAVMVPVFAYGPGAEHFTGIMDNTAIHHKIIELLTGE
jgi:alkaline phosphatase